MASDAQLTLTGYVQRNSVKVSDSQRPSSIRLSVYISGSKAKDNVRRWFVTVKSFNHDAIRGLAEGDKVRVVGRPDVWSPKDQPLVQVVDMMADEGGIVEVDRDGNVIEKEPVAAQSDYDYDEEPF